MKGLQAAVIVLALSIAALALSSSFGTAYPYTIKGYVIDERGHPIQDADITMNSPSALSPLYLNDTTDQTGYYTVTPGINEPQGLANSGEMVSVYAVSGDSDASVQFGIPQNATGPFWFNITLEDPPENPITQPVGLAAIGVVIAAMAVLGVWLFGRRKREEEAERGGGGSSKNDVPKRKRRKP